MPNSNPNRSSSWAYKREQEEHRQKNHGHAFQGQISNTHYNDQYAHEDEQTGWDPSGRGYRSHSNYGVGPWDQDASARAAKRGSGSRDFRNPERAPSQDYDYLGDRERDSEHREAFHRDPSAPSLSAGARPTPGPHAGKGPKNYRRADARIEEEVNEALTADHHIDASEIEVAVKDGVVTLSGTIHDRRTKRLVEDCIDPIAGVIDVRNELKTTTSSGYGNASAGTASSGSSQSGSQTKTGKDGTSKNEMM